jgi:hypothetical protein
LQGRVEASSWAWISRSQAVVTASSKPGSTKITVPLATPASTRLCSVLVPMVSKESRWNSSPKPSIVLSSRGATASGVPSRPVRPVPPELITTCTDGSAIQALSAARMR